VTKSLTAGYPDVKVIAVTRHNDETFVRMMLQAGASGYVLKQSLSGEVMRAIRAVAAGRTYVDSSVTRTKKTGAARAVRAAPVESRTSLTVIEERVLRLVASSLSNHEI